MNAIVKTYLARSCHYFGLPQLSFGVIADGYPLSGFETDPVEGKPQLYKTGSLTKLVTGFAVLLLQERNLLHIDHQVSTYLPWFSHKLNPGIDDTITISSLLLHASGLPRGGLFKNNPSPDELKTSLREMEQLGGAGGKNAFKYSNLGYVLLGFIVEAVTGSSYASFVKAHIFDPLEMSCSGFGYHPDTHELTKPHRLSHFSPKSKTPYDFEQMQLLDAPHASFDMFSSVGDIAKFINYLFDDGIYKGKGICTRHTVEALLGGIHLQNDTLNSGIGFFRVMAFNKMTVFQNGEHWGHSASVLLRPDEKFCLIAMTNRGSAGMDLAFMLQTINKYYLSGKKSSVLTHHYTRYQHLIGDYVETGGNTLTIAAEERQLFASLNNELQSALVYKGQGILLAQKGSLSKYTIQFDPYGDEVGELRVGQFCFVRKSSDLDPERPRYSAITGIYINPVAGRLALFERKNQLVLAYSPFKEAKIEQISDRYYRQIDGPFIGEVVEIDGSRSEFRTGELTFIKTNEKY